MRYALLMGAIVLDNADDLEEGTPATVWVEQAHEPMRLSEPEIELVRQGQAEAARGEGIDARRALEQLRADR